MPTVANISFNPGSITFTGALVIIALVVGIIFMWRHR
jgi:hypothetical protein